MGGITGGGYFFSQPDLLNAFFVAFALKLMATGACAAVSGFATALIADFYKHKIQKKLFKNKYNGERKENETDQSEKVA